jgi:aldose 1-epimerase
MPYQVRTERRPTGADLDGTVYVLEASAGEARAEVWPAFGFNCYHWQASRGGRRLDLLYADPQLFHNSSPTRSGIPILFPFPNRIRDGRFTWEGKEYRLPLIDSTKKNAIHGFACRRPWRVVEQGTDGESAWITGEFRGALDAPEARTLWPADYQIRITYRLTAASLRIEALVENPDRTTLPFGLGYHPYFRVPLVVGGRGEDCWVEVPARSYWELHESLPTGVRRPVDAPRDLNRFRRFSELTLDDVLTDLEGTAAPQTPDLWLRGRVKETPGEVELRLRCSPVFREMVLFTPPHRQAICLEPYTCTTDALNLQQQGLNAGWLQLQPGERWSGVVEMVVSV